MVHELLNVIMNDASRLFGTLVHTMLWDDVYAHVAKLPGALPTGFVSDHITEAWIDFVYCGCHFSINDQFGDYWFFVRDPACPEDVLQRVLTHFKALLG